MKICVFGLWHLGIVTVACLSKVENNIVIGLDPDKKLISDIQNRILPIHELGVEEIINDRIGNNLIFTSDMEFAMKNADILCAAFDTPVDDNDVADTEFVVSQVKNIFRYIEPSTIVIISSQVPVGTTRKLQEEYNKQYPNKNVIFCYIPENLRLGRAIESFINPERIIIGTDNHKEGNKTIVELLSPFCKSPKCNIIWMSIESAEITKHALNAFLATSIVFANEIATLCEKVGADYKEVERGLRTDSRVGTKVYIKAGMAFSGGTLARDIVFLNKIGKDVNESIPLLNAVGQSNNEHKMWVIDKLNEELGIDLKGKTVAILGLTYKNGTNTLRRSGSIELCEALVCRGVKVKCHDPSMIELPHDLFIYHPILNTEKFSFSNSITDTITGCDTIVIATEWDDYKILSVDDILRLGNPLVIDAGRFLEDTLGNDKKIRYFGVGRP